MADMKLHRSRVRNEKLPGTSGVARLDRATGRLVGRLHPGDIAIIQHPDLDLVSAESLVAAKVAGVVNAEPATSGRYPNLGPQLLIQNDIALLDNVGSDVFAAVNEGSVVRILDGDLYLGDRVVAHGNSQDSATVQLGIAEASRNLSAQFEALVAGAGEYMKREGDLLIDGVGVPEVETKFLGRHVVVVVRGYDFKDSLASLKRYIREYRPLLVGVESGAEVLVDAGYTPDLVIGNLDSVPEKVLRVARERVVCDDGKQESDGVKRIKDYGLSFASYDSSCSGEDMALLLADVQKASVIVTVGTHANLNDFLDRQATVRPEVFLTRLRVGAKLVDARTATQIYRSRISAVALLLLVVAMLVALGVAVVVSDSGHSYIDPLSREWHHFISWIRDLF